MALTGELYEAVIRIVDQRVGEIKVTREDFDKLTRTVSELSNIVRDLTEAQMKTEAAISDLGGRVTQLEAAIERLVEAQKRTEERITRLEDAVEKLAEAQKRTDERLCELAEAQRRTDERLNELAEAQRKTEFAVSNLGKRLDELAEAQKRTEDAVGRLAVAVGRLSDTIGYGLEDVAALMLPPWLEKHEHIKVDELERRTIEVEGEVMEFDIYGEGIKAGRKILVIGEVKSRINYGDVKDFAGKLEKVKRALKWKILPVMFGYWIHPTATTLGKTLNIRLVASYQR